MFKKWQQQWQVSGINFVLVICTFAIGGSLCGILARKLIGLVPIDNNSTWVITYVIILTLIWPLCVLAVSVPLGQFNFFKAYLGRIWARIVRKPPSTMHGKKINLAIFASGSGTNAEQIIRYFKDHSHIKVAVVVCNKPGAGVLEKAERYGISTEIIEREQFFRGDGYIPVLQKYGIDWIILAGFLWKVPVSIIREWPGRIINIHPALLPRYGGKGMYGARVHEAVIAGGDPESGITIHFVDEIYDHGEIIFQEKCVIAPGDTPEMLAEKIHALEHAHFPRQIEKTIIAKKQLK